MRDLLPPRAAARRCILCSLTALLPGSMSTAAEEAPPAGKPAPAADLQSRVEAAIERGVAWLRRAQRRDGSFAMDSDGRSENWAGGSWTVGANALAVYTLAACEVPLGDPVLVRGFERIRSDWRTRIPPKDLHVAKPEDLRGDGRTTYFVSLCLMALDAAHNRGATPMGKGPPGGKPPASLAKEDAAWATEMVAWLAETQDDGGEPRSPFEPVGPKRKPRRRPVATGDRPTTDEGGPWGYGNLGNTSDYHDHSNSQFALLGLKSAARLGVDVPRETWIRGLRHFIAAQEPNGPEVPRVDAPGAADPERRPRSGEVVTVGAPREKDEARGWGYICGKSVWGVGLDGEMRQAYGSMTAGGVSSLVIARSELDGKEGFGPGLRALTERGIRDGLAWLAHHWKEIERPLGGRGDTPGRDPGFLEDFYFLYGMERACILGGVARIGSSDWYRTGADVILRSQSPGGEFGEGMAFYGVMADTCFALLFLKRAVFRVPSRAVATEPDAPAAESVDSLLSAWRLADPPGRDRIRDRLLSRGKGVLPDLILRLSDGTPEARTAAFEALEALTGEGRGYDPDGTPAEREKAVQAWEAWWMTAEKRLVPDAAAGRFVERE